MPPSAIRVDRDFHRTTLTVVMAGGCGKRLGDLTRWHSKPALPFAGQYRNIDFPLSNCINSGLRRIAVATQFNAHSLIQHLRLGWNFLRSEVGEFVEFWPAQQRTGSSWYRGTADCIYQNLDLIEQYAPKYILILAGDHVYHMDYRDMLEDHVATGADVTVGCLSVPVSAASQFGVMQTDACNRVTAFVEKPAVPLPSGPSSDTALASMGIYVFSRDFLVDCLRRDAVMAGSLHDFGHDVIPQAISARNVFAHTFKSRRPDGTAYWRDVGTVDSYWQANMELLVENPGLDLYDKDWPMWTYQGQFPPPICIGAGTVAKSMVTAGCRIRGTVEHSVLSRNCAIGPGSKVESTIVLPNASIGRNCRITRAIVESGCEIPDGVKFVHPHDPGTGLFAVSKGGVALLTQDALARVLKRKSQDAAANVTYLASGRKTHNGLPPS